MNKPSNTKQTYVTKLIKSKVEGVKTDIDAFVKREALLGTSLVP